MKDRIRRLRNHIRAVDRGPQHAAVILALAAVAVVHTTDLAWDRWAVDPILVTAWVAATGVTATGLGRSEGHAGVRPAALGRHAAAAGAYLWQLMAVISAAFVILAALTGEDGLKGGLSLLVLAAAYAVACRNSGLWIGHTRYLLENRKTNS